MHIFCTLYFQIRTALVIRVFKKKKKKDAISIMQNEEEKFKELGR